MKEQHAPEEHREIASFHTDNEFNRGITEEDIDFNIPGLPHSTVKQLHGASVRELIQKIENHPHRHVLQRDLQQCQSFNPFSQESKEMIHEVGNISKDSPQGVWDDMAERMLLEFAESGCPIFRVRTPFSRGRLRSKGHGKLSIHCAGDLEPIEIIFRIIVSAYKLSLYGAIAEMCEEYETFHDRSRQPDVLMGQSIVLSEIKAEVPFENDIPSHHNFPLQRYEERIEMFSQENKWSMDAGFIHVVEIGQYFMTKDTGEQIFARS